MRKRTNFPDGSWEEEIITKVNELIRHTETNSRGYHSEILTDKSGSKLYYVRVTDPNGINIDRQYEYDSEGNMIHSVEDGKELINTFAKVGSLTYCAKTVVGDVIVSETIYDGRLITLDGEGKTLVTRYLDNYKIVREEWADGTVTEWEH